MVTPITCRALWDLPNQCLGIICGIWFEGHMLGISFLPKSDQELWGFSCEGHCLY